MPTYTRDFPHPKLSYQPVTSLSVFPGSHSNQPVEHCVQPPTSVLPLVT